MPRDIWSTRAYVVGEILLSLLIAGASFSVLYFSDDQGVKIAAGAALGSVTTFWFSRRQAEQAGNNLAMLANGKLTQLLDAQAQQQQRTDAVVTLMSELRRGHTGETNQP